MNKAYKFRIYPNAEQKIMFSKTFGCTRMIYNYYLEKRIKVYEEEKKTFSYTKCANDLTLLKKEKEFLQDVDSISLQQALRHLDTAFQNFFQQCQIIGTFCIAKSNFFFFIDFDSFFRIVIIYHACTAECFGKHYLLPCIRIYSEFVGFVHGFSPLFLKYNINITVSQQKVSLAADWQFISDQ